MTKLAHSDILETIKMVDDQHLDVRTITMGISLLDCLSDNIDTVCRKIYDKITSKASNLVRTGEDIELEFGKQRADQFQKDIRKQIEDLKVMGNVFAKTQIYYRNYSIHKKLFLPSIIFYIIKEAEKEVHVIRVLREESNWKKILTGQQKYTYE